MKKCVRGPSGRRREIVSAAAGAHRLGIEELTTVRVRASLAYEKHLQSHLRQCSESIYPMRAPGRLRPPPANSRGVAIPARSGIIIH